MRPHRGSPHNEEASPSGRSSGTDEPNHIDPETDEHEADDHEMPRTGITRREGVLFGGFVLAVVAFLYFGLPRLAGFDDTWSRIREGDPIWLLACLVLELISFGGYVWL